MNVDDSGEDKVALQPETTLEEDVVEELQRAAAAIGNQSIDEVVVWRDLAETFDALEDVEPGRPGERALVLSWGPP